MRNFLFLFLALFLFGCGNNGINTISIIVNDIIKNPFFILIAGLFAIISVVLSIMKAVFHKRNRESIIEQKYIFNSRWKGVVSSLKTEVELLEKNISDKSIKGIKISLTRIQAHLDEAKEFSPPKLKKYIKQCLKDVIFRKEIVMGERKDRFYKYWHYVAIYSDLSSFTENATTLICEINKLNIRIESEAENLKCLKKDNKIIVCCKKNRHHPNFGSAEKYNDIVILGLFVHKFVHKSTSCINLIVL